MLNLTPGETHVLVQKLPCFDNPIKLNPLLESSLDLCIHDFIGGFMFHAIMVEIYWCQLFCYLQGVQ
jgi:hypothetical protein